MITDLEPFTCSASSYSFTREVRDWGYEAFEPCIRLKVDRQHYMPDGNLHVRVQVRRSDCTHPQQQAQPGQASAPPAATGAPEATGAPTGIETPHAARVSLVRTPV